MGEAGGKGLLSFSFTVISQQHSVYLCRNIMKVTQSSLFENPFRPLQAFHIPVAQSGNGSGCSPPVSLLGWLHPLQPVIVRPPSVMAQQYWTVRRYRHCFRKVCKRQGMCQIVYNADVWSLWLHFTFWSKETFRNLGNNMECWEFFIGELKFFQNMFWPLFD